MRNVFHLSGRRRNLTSLIILFRDPETEEVIVFRFVFNLVSRLVSAATDKAIKLSALDPQSRKDLDLREMLGLPAEFTQRRQVNNDNVAYLRTNCGWGIDLIRRADFGNIG